jgi:hypothetical protein
MGHDDRTLGDCNAPQSRQPPPRFIVAKLLFLCHKPGFVDRLIKGCRGDVCAGSFNSEKTLALPTL